MAVFGQPSLLGWIMAVVGILDGLRRRRNRDVVETTDRALATEHLESFVSRCRGVEVFVEQPTSMAGSSLLLIAYDGEWTRRSVPSADWARRFAASHKLPCYDAGVVPYPQRMRDYNNRIKGDTT